MLTATIGSGRVVEVLHYRGRVGEDRWMAGSGYLIGRRLVLTAAHCVDYQQNFDDDEQLLVRTLEGNEFTAQVMLVGDELSQVDLALLEISDPWFDEQLPSVNFAQVDRDSPTPVPNCWAVGFPRFEEIGPVLPEGSHRETWHVSGDIFPGTKRRAGLLSLLVTSRPQPLPTSLAGSAWEGMSGSVVFTSDPHVGELAVGVVSTHHRPEGESSLSLVPITALARLPTAPQWWRHLAVPDPDALPLLPRPSGADQQRSRLAGERAFKEHWDPRGRGVEQPALRGWFFTGRRRALSRLVGWLTAAPAPSDNLWVVTGGPGSGKSAVLARLVTMSNPRYRANMPELLAADDPVADLPVGVIDVAVDARDAPTDEIVRALAIEAGEPQADLENLINKLLERPEPFTIVLDGLDEAADPPGLALALRRLATQAVDAGLRMLVGTRAGGAHRRLITALGLSADDPAVIDLDDPRYLSLEDLAEFVRRRLLLADVRPIHGRRDTPYRDRETLARQVADAVARAAYPAFLIGQIVSRSLVLRDQPISPGDPDWRNFPTTVAAAMDQYLASISDQAKGNHAKQDSISIEDLLRPLAYARGDGLPHDNAGLWSRLATALALPGHNYTNSDVARLLGTAADYLIETVITGQAAYYRLYHQALIDRLRGRDQQRQRPVSAAQTVYQCLLSTVARKPDGTLNWPTAQPYVLSHLAGYAADADQLTSLVDDPGFLISADPAGLFSALQRPGQPLTGNAQIYRHAYPSLPVGADKAGERASYLQLAARRHHARLSDQLAELPSGRPWVACWVRGDRPDHPHYIVGRHEAAVDAVTVGERAGRPVVISASDDQAVRLWDLESGELVLGPLTGHDGPVNAVAVGERAGRPVIVSGGYQTVRVWDLESGELVLGPLTGHHKRVEAVAVGMRAGRPVIVSGGGSVRVWDLESGEPVLGPLTGHHGLVNAVDVGMQAGRPVIVSGGGDQAVRVWDLESGELVLGPLTGHDGGVYAVAISEREDGPVVVSGGRDQTVRVWHLESDHPTLGPTTSQGGSVRAVTFSERGGEPLIISAGFTLKLWDPESGEQKLGRLTTQAGPVRAVAVGERFGQSVVVSASHQTVRVWNLELGELVLGPLTGHHGPVNAVAVSQRYGRPVIVSAGYDETVRVWDLELGELVLGPLTGHHGPVNAVAVGKRWEGPVIVSAGEDETVRVWDLESGELVLDPLTGHHGPVNAVAVGKRGEGPIIVSASDDQAVRVWDLQSGNLALGPFTGHDGPVNAVAVTERSGRPAIVSGDDRAVRLWDIGSEPHVTIRIELQRRVLAVASSADQLAIGTTAELLLLKLL